ncbi:MAG: hypothetical protein AB3N33_02220 [Puniceicoccaceae bacterium]
MAAVVLFAGTNMTLAQKIDARPLTPQEIHDNELPEGVHASAGLLVVAVGEPVYLEAQVPAGTVVNGVTWSIEQRPLASPPSVAELQDSPLGDMPIYSPGDREVLAVAGRKLLVPDAVGKYMVQAVVQTDAEALVLTAQVTGATYVGVGTMGGASPSYPQCALCHQERAVEYMATGHASMFTLAIDGLKSSHYNSNCIECHTLGGHVEGVDNGSFSAVADSVGWTFPEVLEPGVWAAMDPALQAKANIQCEHCHGAGSEHHGDLTTTAVSLSSGDCGQCHDEEPYHNRNQQWNLSAHSVATRYPTGSERRRSCTGCHSGIAFIERMDGVAQDDRSFEYEAIVCAACHDPHSAENEHQLRSLADIELENGHMVTEGGTGKLCMNCHKARRDADSYTDRGVTSSHFGPHYGVQGDIFNGTNLVEFDGKVQGGASSHLYILENSCASCHMQATDRNNDPFHNKAGDHTFKIVWDNDTPEDHSDDVPLTGGCYQCHGPLDTFDIPTVDYNYDGHLEGLQTEIHHLLEALAMKLPPYGEPRVVRDPDLEYTPMEAKALYNYMAVEEDGSHGMHNPRYVAQILKASIEAVSDPYTGLFNGANIPVGGEWYYSQWFEFYAPQSTPDWIYHFEHGHLYVTGDSSTIYLYDVRTNSWRWTNEEVYPLMYDVGAGTWMYYSGRYAGMRYFWNYNAGDWVVVE